MKTLPVLLAWFACHSLHAFELATFSADVTPPLGHQLFTGGVKPATAVDDPLLARGFVLSGVAGGPVVFVAVDWTEIRNDAYDRWREALAQAAGTTRERVLVASIHQHDAPLADLRAQQLLDEAGSGVQLIDPEFHEACVRRVAAALREALPSAKQVTHIGTGEGEVRELASNRRFVSPGGAVSYGRGSGGASLQARLAPEGTIDAMLKTLSFWHGDKALCALSVYAVHPMSYYRTGRISADFPGLARQMRQDEAPGVFQIYASGASGNLTGGKYNNGETAMRTVFAERLLDGMRRAWENTRLHPLEESTFLLEKLELQPRSSPGFQPEELAATLNDAAASPQKRGMAALGLSWRERADAGQAIDLPLLDLGPAKLLLLPGEIYVEYQLHAQGMRPDSFVMAAGYGECAPGYLPIDQAWEEGDSNLGGWCWVDPGMETVVMAALAKLLQP